MKSILLRDCEKNRLDVLLKALVTACKSEINVEYMCEKLQSTDDLVDISSAFRGDWGGQ